MKKNFSLAFIFLSLFGVAFSLASCNKETPSDNTVPPEDETTYTVTFKNYDETVLETQTLTYGTTPVYGGETPTKDATAQYTYTFNGWDNEIVAVTGETTYTATYTSIVNNYTITFKNDDYTVLETQTLEYGATPVYGGEAPTKTATPQYTYTFNGWDKELAEVTGEETYTATYTSTVNTYKVTFESNGGTIIPSITQEYGSEITAPTAPTFTGKTFVGWFDQSFTNQYQFTTKLTEDITLYAKWIDYEVNLTCLEINKVSVNDDITDPNLYQATAIDTDGKSVDVSVSLVDGKLESGNTITVKLVAMGLYDIYDTQTISGIKVYGNPIITYNTNKDDIKFTDTLNAELFSATAKDTYENAIPVILSTKEENYQPGDIITIILTAVDSTNNKAVIEIEGVKVYELLTIKRDENIDKIKTTDNISNDTFGIYAEDSFGERIEVVTKVIDGEIADGNIITVQSTAIDKAQNEVSITYQIKIYGNPTISLPSKVDFKVGDEITLETLGIVCKDSFQELLSDVSLELKSGTQEAGETMTFLVTAKDILGNISASTISNIKIYGKPTVVCNEEIQAVNYTDQIDEIFFGAIAYDSFNYELDVTITLERGEFIGGNMVTYKLTAVDHLGNETSVIIDDVKVYSSDDIQLTYDANIKNIKISSIKDDFNAKATNSFNEQCAISIVPAEGYQIESGQTINLYIVARDSMGNTTRSEMLCGIKVYDTPTLTYSRNSQYILTTDDPYTFFSVKDSFDNKIPFEVEIASGSLEQGGAITFEITALDIANNSLIVKYELVVLDENQSVIEYYRNGLYVDSLLVKKGDSYSLPIGYEYWLNGEKLTDFKSDSIHNWDKESNIYEVKQKIITYSIKYYLAVGTNSDLNPSTYTVEDEIIFKEPTIPQLAVVDGVCYKTVSGFEGWYLDSTFTDPIIQLEDGIYGNLKLHAKITTTTLTVDDYLDNGGTFESYLNNGGTIESYLTKDGKYVRVNKDGNYQANGSYILLGSYPQTRVTDESTLQLLSHYLPATKPTNDNSQLFISYKYYIDSSNNVDYMWYKDIDMDYDGAYDYRCVYFDQYRTDITSENSTNSIFYQEINGYIKGNYYFFKYEPIKWRILTESNGKATLLAELILDSQDFYHDVYPKTVDGQTIYPTNYEYSCIREWLNKDFYNTAFNGSQKGIIETTLVDNNASTTHSSTNGYACNNTNDKVWLLSYQEAYNSNYGFNSENDRIKIVTDYAQSQGTCISIEPSVEGNGYWWLRSPDDYNGALALYIGIGNIHNYSIISHTRVGVVPAVTINL